MKVDRGRTGLRSLPSVAPRRSALAALAGGIAAMVIAPLPRQASGKKRRRNPCRGKNWCIDRTQTCGPVGGHKKCLVEAYGGNVCAEILFQAPSCDACDPPNCTSCLCALAAGGGDHCNNGANSHNDFICVRA